VPIAVAELEPMPDTNAARFAAETRLLGLELLPGQELALQAAYAALGEMLELVGADYPFEAEPAHVFIPAPQGPAPDGERQQ
jgi:hypothetical protein